MNKRAATYTRTATTGQRGQAIEAQAEQCRAYAEARGWEVTACFTDPGMSGATVGRPGLQELLNGTRAGTFDTVIVADVDRLARDVTGLEAIWRELEASNVQVVEVRP